jgi:hypothetical protein
VGTVPLGLVTASTRSQRFFRLGGTRCTVFLSFLPCPQEGIKKCLSIGYLMFWSSEQKIECSCRFFVVKLVKLENVQYKTDTGSYESGNNKIPNISVKVYWVWLGVLIGYLFPIIENCEGDTCCCTFP